MQYPFHEIVKIQCCVARFHIFLQKLDKLVQLQLRRDMTLYRIYSIKHRDIYMYYFKNAESEGAFIILREGGGMII